MSSRKAYRKCAVEKTMFLACKGVLIDVRRRHSRINTPNASDRWDGIQYSALMAQWKKLVEKGSQYWWIEVGMVMLEKCSRSFDEMDDQHLCVESDVVWADCQRPETWAESLKPGSDCRTLWATKTFISNCEVGMSHDKNAELPSSSFSVEVLELLAKGWERIGSAEVYCCPERRFYLCISKKMCWVVLIINRRFGLESSVMEELSRRAIVELIFIDHWLM